MTFWNTYEPTGQQGSESVAYNYASSIYIGSAISDRYIELPAYIKDLKYTVNKSMETIEEKDKTGGRYIEKASAVSMTLTIDVPAASALEAKSNLARVSEIMRMISPSGGFTTITTVGGKKETTSQAAIAPKVYLLCSNLISFGRKNSIDKIGSFAELKSHGVPGYIKDFDYTPDIEAGFFIDVDYRAPRNIKVNISLSIDAFPRDIINQDALEAISQEQTTVLDEVYVIRGLSITGEFMPGDGGGWPFGISIKDSRQSGGTYNYKTLNSHSKDYADTSKSFFMIGNNEKEQRGNFKSNWSRTQRDIQTNSIGYGTPVYCLFKMFLEDFKFSKKTSLEPKEIVDTDIGRAFFNYSDSNSVFDIKFTIVADSLEQAKKNCGKVQILFRLLLTENEYDSGSWSNYGNIFRNVYSPDLIERHDSDGIIKNDPEALWQNGVGCKMSKITVDFDNDLGYFVENDGGNKKYYPKGFKISMTGDITGREVSPHLYAGRPGNYKSDGKSLIRDDVPRMINFPFKFK